MTRSFFLRFYLFLERREGGREGEKQQWVRETSTGCLGQAPTQEPGPRPGMGPDGGIGESNRQPFSLRDDAQPMQPHQLGHHLFLKIPFWILVINTFFSNPKSQSICLAIWSIIFSGISQCQVVPCTFSGFTSPHLVFKCKIWQKSAILFTF